MMQIITIHIISNMSISMSVARLVFMVDNFVFHKKEIFPISRLFHVTKKGIPS